MRLIITEKPSVARDIARVLGAKSKHQGYIEGKNVRISWCFGHMASLAEPDSYNPAWKKWSASELPMIPDSFKLVGRSGARDQLKVLKSQLHSTDITEVVNACDAGREGELIFRYVYDLCRARKPVQRLWLSSMTDTAIRQAFGALQPGKQYDALGDAARCRSEADWLVGMNGTRALTIRCRKLGASEVMSVGRVQTPTLAMIVERELEIEAFVPETFWQVYATFDAGEQPEGIESTYEGTWTHKKQDRTFKKEEAEKVIEEIEGKTGKVVKVQHKDVRQRPPSLFDLTSLQREGNKRFGFSAQKVLDIAQSLYENHKLLTYPRTDSNYLTSDMKKGLPGIIDKISVPPYDNFCQDLLADLPLKVTKRIVDDNEVGDHHAIIPTDRTPDLTKLDAGEKKIYDLVVRRFLGAFYPDAVFATTKIATAVEGHVFVTSGRVRKEAGWQVVDPPPKYNPKKGKRGKKSDPILPSVSKGDEVAVAEQRLHEGQTQPPKRFNENSLLGSMERAGANLDDEVLRRAMKESGLGTPATRAGTIELLLKRSYIERKGKNLVPTDRGRALIMAVPVEDLKSAKLTGSWEAKLTRVANGKLARDTFMQEVNKLTAKVTKALLEQEIDLPQDAFVSDREILGKCPICNQDVYESHKAYTCTTGRDCTFVIFKSVAKRKISKNLVKVLLSGKTSKTLKGFRSKKGNKFEAALKLDAEGKVEMVFENSYSSSSSSSSSTSDGQKSKPKRASSKKTDKAAASRPTRQRAQPQPASPAADSITCPKCKQGHIIEGKRGWGCARWREGCDFVVWYEQDGVKISKSDGEQLISSGKSGPIAALGGVRLVLDLSVEGNVRIAG